MRGESERKRGSKARGGARPAGVAGPVADFAAHPVYQEALRLCGLVLDLESKFPDDEHPVLYVPLKRCAIEAGSLLASGFGRSAPSVRLDLWERARSRAMEARHLVLVARMRYVVDARDVDLFEERYFLLLDGIETLIGTAAGEELTSIAAGPPRER